MDLFSHVHTTYCPRAESKKVNVLRIAVPVLAHMETQKGIEGYTNLTGILLTDFEFLINTIGPKS
jgi:hypothetical protein